jgi:plasmid stability protein
MSLVSTKLTAMQSLITT